MGWDNTGRRRKRARPLDAMREAQGRGEAPAPARSRPEPEPQAQPAGKRRGRDTDIWHLAELFRQCAQADGIELAKGLPVICTEINDLVTRYGIRGQTYRHDTFGCKHRADHPGLASRCWYHWPPRDPGKQEARVITWVQMVEVIMAEFWSRTHDVHALDQFRQSFAEYGQAAVKHWWVCRVSRDIASQPPRPRVRRVRQEQPSATMQDASKEG